MPLVDLGDFRIYYDEHGRGEPVVWLHGFTLEHRMWRPQVDYFASHYRLILPDARGHGRSDVTATGYSRADRVSDLLRLLDALEIDRCHVVGLSMGGSTAIGLALTNQDRLLSLTLISTGVAGYGAGKKLDRLDAIGRQQGPAAAKAIWLEWALAWYRHPDRAAIGTQMREMIEQYSGAVWADPMRGRYPREYDLDHVHAVTLPTLIVAGERDRIFVPLARELHVKIQGSRLIVYPDTGHMVNLERPEQLNSDLKVFLELQGQK